jgi:hypothetical protein
MGRGPPLPPQQLPAAFGGPPGFAPRHPLPHHQPPPHHGVPGGYGGPAPHQLRQQGPFPPAAHPGMPPGFGPPAPAAATAGALPSRAASRSEEEGEVRPRESTADIVERRAREVATARKQAELKRMLEEHEASQAAKEAAAADAKPPSAAAAAAAQTNGAPPLPAESAGAVDAAADAEQPPRPGSAGGGRGKVAVLANPSFAAKFQRRPK